MDFKINNLKPNRNMKTKIALLIAIIAIVSGLSTQAQTTTYMTTGRFTVQTSKKDYHITKKDFSEAFAIASSDSGVATSNEWHTLSSGIKVKFLHPTEWATLILAAYEIIDHSININNVQDAIMNSDTVIWNSTMPLVRNYYWSAGGAIAYMPDYSGAAMKVPVISYQGIPVIKRSCWNPQLLNSLKADNILSSVTFIRDTIVNITFVYDTIVNTTVINNTVINNSTPTTTDTHVFGQDGQNVVTYIPGGYTEPHDIGGGWNVVSWVPGGYNYPHPLDGGMNTTNYVAGGSTPSHSLNGGMNTTNTVNGGTTQQYALSTSTNTTNTVNGGTTPSHDLGGGTNVVTTTPGGH